MQLTNEEQAILSGEQGDTLKKVAETVIRYGQIFDANELKILDHPSHLVTSVGIPLLKPAYMMTDELIESGLQAKMPFTVDPRPHEDAEKLYNPFVRMAFKLMFGKQRQYEAQLAELGIKNNNAFTCTCYQDEVGNIPAKGSVLAWAESSAVVYANSVLGARTNRNSAFIELFCAILGKAPNFGLLTDEGRKADWIIELQLNERPSAQLLGGLIGQTVVDGVPFITGLERWIGNSLTSEVKGYLKDLGAASASNGAVGLFHVDGLTPEAKEQGRRIIKMDAKLVTITDGDLKSVRDNYPVLWKKEKSRPKYCFVGCPHLSYRQLVWWAEHITAELNRLDRRKIKIKTVLTAAPDVTARFQKENTALGKQLERTGVVVSTFCPLANLNNPLLAKTPVITNSNKLRTYTIARYYEDDEILRYLTTGRLDQ